MTQAGVKHGDVFFWDTALALRSPSSQLKDLCQYYHFFHLIQFILVSCVQYSCQTLYDLQNDPLSKSSTPLTILVTTILFTIFPMLHFTSLWKGEGIKKCKLIVISIIIFYVHLDMKNWGSSVRLVDSHHQEGILVLRKAWRGRGQDKVLTCLSRHLDCDEPFQGRKRSLRLFHRAVWSLT